jgi:2-succinyl-5-enolpyruvyl-6-hydroxy-3-cyclohexene-1-carboxylate synthase
LGAIAAIMTATDTYLILRAFCDELARCGLEHACTSPGSRNTPILLSLAREPRIRCWSHIDERCAAFFALGAAKASQRPVAITCTSGTAAANYTPAVIEAFHARVPLIVLSADRPPELRDVGAGQAIDQLKLYGDAVKWFCEVGVDAATPDTLRWIRQLACRAYWTALDGRPGPVHLNFPLREPLVLEDPLPEDPVPGRYEGPWVEVRSWPRSMSMTRAGFPPARGIIVAGRAERGHEIGEAAAEAAQARGWPLLADPLSGARHGSTAIATYDLLLRDPDFAERARPDVVVRVGDLPTSKPLRAWLASLNTDQLLLDPDGAWQDPAAVVDEIHRGVPAPELKLLAQDPGPVDPAWLQQWRDADTAATGAIARGLADTAALTEPLTARLLGERLSPDATLVVASSMPIRDAELYLPAGSRGPRVLANRGANGIDGTVSTAYGVAAVTEGPVFLLIGDVALAHDIGGLIAGRQLGLDLTIVLVNNDGGGIFHFLPVSGQSDVFEEHVATPHGLDFSKAAALYGLDHTRVRTADELIAALRRPGIVEVRTDRAENLALHRSLADAGLAAVRALSPTAPATSPAA